MIPHIPASPPVVDTPLGTAIHLHFPKGVRAPCRAPLLSDNRKTTNPASATCRACLQEYPKHLEALASPIDPIALTTDHLRDLLNCDKDNPALYAMRSDITGRLTGMVYTWDEDRVPPGDVIVRRSALVEDAGGEPDVDDFEACESILIRLLVSYQGKADQIVNNEINHAVSDRSDA